MDLSLLTPFWAPMLLLSLRLDELHHNPLLPQHPPLDGYMGIIGDI